MNFKCSNLGQKPWWWERMLCNSILWRLKNIWQRVVMSLSGGGKEGMWSGMNVDTWGDVFVI